MRPDPRRRGAVLILVAGVAALIGALAVALLSRARDQTAESARVVAEAQARIMLAAACGYVLESGRLGYGEIPPGAPVQREAFGWLDVRDGATGPRDDLGAALFSSALVERSRADGAPDRPAWPAVGAVVRCPMAVRERPPFAVAMNAAPNAIALDGPDAGMPYLRAPDPQPAVGNGWPGAVDATAFDDFVRGLPRPRPESVGLGWFRLHRVAAAAFVVTCGSGASAGWRDWQEIPDADRAAYGDDAELFAQLAAAEVRTWYRIEWSAAIPPCDSHSIENEAVAAPPDPMVLHPMNTSQMSRTRSLRSQARSPNLVGTIRYIERLASPPAVW
ncbi:MAG TPA: hypothetical protein VEL07_01300 [Planctomycetota bacterium]|nr:hypothetical protein [Planctomycetota bacterium]